MRKSTISGVRSTVWDRKDLFRKTSTAQEPSRLGSAWLSNLIYYNSSQQCTHYPETHLYFCTQKGDISFHLSRNLALSLTFLWWAHPQSSDSTLFGNNFMCKVPEQMFLLAAPHILFPAKEPLRQEDDMKAIWKKCRVKVKGHRGLDRKQAPQCQMAWEALLTPVRATQTTENLSGKLTKHVSVWEKKYRDTCTKIQNLFWTSQCPCEAKPSNLDLATQICSTPLAPAWRLPPALGPFHLVFSPAAPLPRTCAPSTETRQTPRAKRLWVSFFLTYDNAQLTVLY